MIERRGHRTGLSRHLRIAVTVVAVGVAACRVQAPAEPGSGGAELTTAGASAVAGAVAKQHESEPATARVPSGVGPVPEAGTFPARDPFRAAPGPCAPASPGALVVPPLQSYDAGAFRLVGVIDAPPESQALLLDPCGGTSVVRLGTYVGRNWGRVSAITSNEVIVPEEYQTFEPVYNYVKIGF